MTPPVPTRNLSRWPSLRWWLALVPLIVLVHELHELAHTAVGRIACGVWASRDFSRWSIPGCDSLWPVAAGPLFSYLLMAVAVAGLRRGTVRPGWSLAVLVAANPLARIITAASGHGDEVRVARALFGDAPDLAWAGAAALVLVLTGIALGALWRATHRWRGRAGMALWLAMMPILVTGPGTQLGNRLLQAGWLDRPFAGAPALVHGVTLLALLLLLLLLVPLPSAAQGTSRGDPAA